MPNGLAHQTLSHEISTCVRFNQHLGVRMCVFLNRVAQYANPFENHTPHGIVEVNPLQGVY